MDVEHDRGTANGECQWNRAAPLYAAKCRRAAEPQSSVGVVVPGPKSSALDRSGMLSPVCRCTNQSVQLPENHPTAKFCFV